jgi:hypothetical protein
MLDRSRITTFFDSASSKVYSYRDLATLLHENRSAWGFPSTTTIRDYLQYLVEQTQMHVAALTSDVIAAPTKYVWGNASPYEVALSLRPKAYLSHGTAVYLHGLTDRFARVIHLNQEQSSKPKGDPHSLTQESIRRAFAGQQRQSRLFFSYETWTIQVLNGKFTNHLEVGTVATPDGLTVPVTKLERTLIDIAVRPLYAGGIHQVLDAYRAARDRVSSNVLASTLRKLDYVYPYHQVVGFYLDRAGYGDAALAKMREFGVQFDFFLTYGIKDTDFDSKWRLFIPKAF